VLPLGQGLAEIPKAPGVDNVPRGDLFQEGHERRVLHEQQDRVKERGNVRDDLLFLRCGGACRRPTSQPVKKAHPTLAFFGRTNTLSSGWFGLPSSFNRAVRRPAPSETSGAGPTV